MLVEIEGMDASGKSTLTKALVAHFTRFKPQGIYDVYGLAFPDHESRTGKLIREWLRKEWTTGDDLRDAYVHQCLHVVNRLDLFRDLNKPGSAPTLVICDRYYTSTMVYGLADGLDEEWLRGVLMQLPTPDLSIYLRIDPEKALARKEGVRDRYENPAYLERIYAGYEAAFRPLLSAALGTGLHTSSFTIDATESFQSVLLEAAGHITWAANRAALSRTRSTP